MDSKKTLPSHRNYSMLFSYLLFFTNRKEMPIRTHSLSTWILLIIAVLFGLMTIKSGGNVLFVDGQARQAAGNYVDFVLWFNFVAGFFYVATGIGIYLEKAWTTSVAVSLALLTLLAFCAFGIHIFNGGEYEARTVYAMTLRSLVWIVIAAILWRRARL